LITKTKIHYTNQHLSDLTANISIDYFGQTPPDTIPIIFVPGIICLDNRSEAQGAFSPEGRMFYFIITNEDFTFQKTLFCENLNNKWTKPDTASFSNNLLSMTSDLMLPYT
jgi:hypothetical protein